MDLQGVERDFISYQSDSPCYIRAIVKQLTNI